MTTTNPPPITAMTASDTPMPAAAAWARIPAAIGLIAVQRRDVI